MRIYSATRTRRHEEKIDITITIHMWSGFFTAITTPHINEAINAVIS
jgi:hypothetical protein